MFIALDRNARTRIIFFAEALDRQTHEPGQHGGVLKRTGLAVLKALLFTFHNVATGRCDPGFDALAAAAGVARSTLAKALDRLEAAGLIVRTRRRIGTVRLTNAYAFRDPSQRVDPGRNPSGSAWSDSRPQTTNRSKNNLKTAKTVPAPQPDLWITPDERRPLSAYGDPAAHAIPLAERMRHLFEILEQRERRLGRRP